MTEPTDAQAAGGRPFADGGVVQLRAGERDGGPTGQARRPTDEEDLPIWQERCRVLEPGAVHAAGEGVVRASGGKAGWQQVKISRNRSSSILGSSKVSRGAVSVSSCLASSATEVSKRVRRRIRSIALKRPAEISQARGFPGMPSRDHCPIAAINASCNASSARSKSPSRRISVARTRRDKLRPQSLAPV